MTRTKRMRQHDKRREQNKKYCPSGKVAFRTKLDADIGRLHASAQSHGQVQLNGSYRCRFCKKWHVTSRIKSMSGYEYTRLEKS